MKTLREVQSIFTLHPQETASRISYLMKQNIDWDVFLVSKNMNLQRDFVWDIIQKRELIWSILIGRHIPHCAIIRSCDINYNDVFLIIDGKQRLSSIFDYVNNKYTLIIDNVEYYYSELPREFQLEISNYFVRYYTLNEEKPNTFTDEDKINWFRFINYAGTLQDAKHIENLLK